MEKPVIQVENLSKAYQIGQIGTGTISRDIERFWLTKVLGKEDPFLKIGETNHRSLKGESDIVWSLKDINFEVNAGDAVGIIGKNGAGKSTLLKLLSRVTSPTTGEIKVKGRIASLLEVGTGFHPELSGRENIYLNGAILGMRKNEITRKLDEIIDFSGVERYIDTPVKRYSSGMYVRLAFSVAAHLESEILIVDEVLAVGDAEFQKKCLGKMGEISKGEGRTVLFVSHNMAAVQNLCSKGILLDNGTITFNGAVSDAVNNYIDNGAKQSTYINQSNKSSMIHSVETIRNIESSSNFGYLDDIIIRIKGNYLKGTKVKVGVALLDRNKTKIFTVHYDLINTDKGFFDVNCFIPKKLICSGIYSFDVALFNTNGIVFDYVKDICQITVTDTGSDMLYDKNFGSIYVNCKWDENTL